MKTRLLYMTSLVAAVLAVIGIIIGIIAARNRASHNGPSVGVWGPCCYTVSPGASKKAVPGIDQASLAVGIWSADPAGADPAFVVWAGESSGGGLAADTPPPAGESQRRITTYQGSVGGVPVECRTSDGRTGTVKIGGEEYQLGQGALFLVSRSAGKPKVKQLPLATLNLKPAGTQSLDQMTGDYLRGLARTDPEINGFFTATDQAL